MIKVIFLGIIVAVSGELAAPYPPSGWRPQGQPFTLPSRQVQTEYGAPNQAEIPNRQYLPNSEPAGDFARNNFAPNGYQPDRINLNNQQQPNTQYSSNFQPTQNDFASNSNDAFSSRFPNPQNNQNTRGNLRVQPQNNNFQSDASTDSFNSRQKNFNQVERFNPAPGRNNNRDSDEDDTEEVLLNQENGDFDYGVVNTPSREYGAVSTTSRPAKSKKKVDRTTPRPTTTTEANNDSDLNQPNIAVSTAVAGSGQYYILQPDGRLQRVIYMTEANSDTDKSFTANLMYENVEPIKGPIFSYNESPLIRIN